MKDRWLHPFKAVITFRQYTAILLVVGLLGPFMLSIVGLRVEKYFLQQDIQAKILGGLEEKELVELKFSMDEAKKQLHWEHQGEFEYQEQMYDVVEVRQQGDSISYICLMDHRETFLNKQLDKLIAQALGQHPFQKENHQKITDFFKSLYFNPSLHEPFFELEDKGSLCTAYPLFPLRWLQGPIPPPPKARRQVAS